MTAGSIEGPAAGYRLHEAAAMLGVSVNTLRKRIRTGQVRAEQVQRPQGYVWQVYLGDLHPPGQPADDPAGQQAPWSLQNPPTALMQAEAMAAYTRSLLEPLVRHVAELETTVRCQAETIGRQSAELERAASVAVKLSDELDAARGQISTLTASTAPQSVEPTTEAPTARPASTTWLTPQRFWLIAALVLVLIGVGVVQVGVALYSLAVQLAMPG